MGQILCGLFQNQNENPGTNFGGGGSDFLDSQNYEFIEKGYVFVPRIHIWEITCECANISILVKKIFQATGQSFHLAV